MRTTIELAKECDLETIGDYGNTWYIPIEKLEAFRLAVEAEFVSRCSFEGYKNSDNTPLYTLPKDK